MKKKFFIGTAGWSLPSQLKDAFSGRGRHLSQYSEILNCCEINSSFYRTHKYETYVRWAASVPTDFKFSVKLSKHFTQVNRLTETGSALKENIQTMAGLGAKWGVLLIQLPPSLNFNPRVANRFLKKLRQYYLGSIVIEPRDQSWGSHTALELLSDYKVGKVLADPERCKIPRVKRPQVEKIRYLRLHGTPQIYKSSYSDPILERIKNSLLSPISEASETWCIFDNTAYGFGTQNALTLKALINN
jgi:uncharacterized protein YecE (DUF72 family)